MDGVAYKGYTRATVVTWPWVEAHISHLQHQPVDSLCILFFEAELVEYF